MKILVTGSSGKVGSEVVKEIYKRGAAVRALVHKEGKGTDLPEEVESSSATCSTRCRCGTRSTGWRNSTS